MRARGTWQKIYYDNSEVNCYKSNSEFISTRNHCIILCWADIIAGIINLGLSIPNTGFTYLVTGGLSVPLAIMGLFGAINCLKVLGIIYGMVSGGLLGSGFVYSVTFYVLRGTSSSVLWYSLPYFVHMVSGLYALYFANQLGELEESSDGSYQRFQSQSSISFMRFEEQPRRDLERQATATTSERTASAATTNPSNRNSSAGAAALMRFQTTAVTEGEKCRSCGTGICEYAFSPCKHPALCRDCVGFAQTYLESIGNKCPVCGKSPVQLERIWKR